MPAAAPQASGLKPQDSSSWLPIKIAAQRLGICEGNLRRRCAESWKRENLARQVNGKWFVDPAADSRLGNQCSWRQRDLEQLAELEARGVPAKYLSDAKDRRDVLQAYERFSAEHTSLRPRERRKLFCQTAQGQAVSVARLYIHQAAYEAQGIAALVSGHAFRADVDEGGFGGEALDFIDNLLNCGSRISAHAAFTIARGQAARHPGDPRWRMTSYRSLLIELKQRRPAALKLLADKGERAAKADCVPKMERDFEQLASGDEYVGDERTLDVWVRVLTSRGWRAVRPKLTAWLDMRSRIMVGWILAPHASSETILASLKLAVAAHGKPLRIRTDWGEDYRCAAKRPKYKTFDGRRIGSILDDLGIEVRRVAPYTPYAKPIESFFRTLKDHCDRLFSAFWGGCPSERHEDRAKFLRANLEKLPTLEEVSKTLQRFFDVYHATPHSAIDLFGKSPLEAMAAFRDGPARMESDAVLDHLFRIFTEPKLVRRDGVRHDGRWFGNGDHRLFTMQGQKVILGLQPDDAGRAMVCDLDRTPRFEIECVNMRGLTTREANDMVRARRRLLRPFKEQAQRGREFLLATSPDKLLALRAAGVRAMHGAGSVGVPPASSLRIRPALEEAIDSAAPQASSLKSQALKTGTDDEVTLADMLDDSPLPACGTGYQPVEDDSVDLNWNDLTGELA